MRLVSHRTGFFGLVALAVMAVVLPVAGSGCGRTSCFVYTKAEYDAHQGSCPSDAAALPSFTDTSCPGPVMSVDGPGIFTLNEKNPEQSLCCYPVTQRDVDPDFFNSGECVPAGGFGGDGFGGVGGGFGSTGVVGVGVGGGGFMGCLTCSQMLGGLGAPTGPVCDAQVAGAWQNLQLCACAAAGPCAKVCALNLCKDATISKDCRTCLEDTATSGCGGELIGCESD